MAVDVDFGLWDIVKEVFIEHGCEYIIEKVLDKVAAFSRLRVNRTSSFCHVLFPASLKLRRGVPRFSCRVKADADFKKISRQI